MNTRPIHTDRHVNSITSGVGAIISLIPCTNPSEESDLIIKSKRCPYVIYCISLFSGFHGAFFLNNRRSYMSAHALLNLLNELGKRDKMQGLLRILSLFRNEFNKFNNTSARMLHFIFT